MFAYALALAAVIFGTWNGKWFPSGRAEHRASAAVEARAIAGAGRFLRAGIARLDPQGTNDIILCINEIRDEETAAALCQAIGRTNLNVAIITRYRRRDRYDQQQDAILTTLPVAESHWFTWKRPTRNLYPPRGAACAALILNPATTAAVYSVHLKSNYGATSAAKKEANRVKRTQAIDQLLADSALRDKPVVLIAGDFNADKWRDEFKSETIFTAFKQNGFIDVLEQLPVEERVTYPNVWNGDSTLDYLMIRGMKAEGPTLTLSSEGISDHHAVLTLIR